MKKPEFNQPLVLGLALSLLVLAVFWPATGYDFFAVDDYGFIADDPAFASGMSLAEIFRTIVNLPNFWKPIPVTWLSFIADSTIFGATPSVYHRTSVLLHSLNAFLLFLVMKRATGSNWKGLAVAFIFALHPLRVESVAWISARKDLLSLTFLLLCLLGWERYAKTKKLRWYFVAGITLAMGLLSKPVLVTVPFLLIISDYWPLGRLDSPSKLLSLSVEKIPLAILSVLSAALTISTQQKSIISAESITFADRLTDTIVSYCHYLSKFIYPSDLVFLPRSAVTATPLYQVLFLLLFLVSMTFLSWRFRKTAPFFLAGWLWYLVALFPNCGIMPVGMTFLADRYTYIPLIGIAIIFVWGIERLGDCFPDKKKLLPLAAIIPASLLILTTRAQLPHWRDTLAVADRTESVTADIAYANEIRAFAYIKRGEYGKAVEFAKVSLSKDPKRVSANFYMAESLFELGKLDLAETFFKRALALQPDYIPGLYNYGLLLAKADRFVEAERNFEEAARLAPKNPNAFLEWGLVLVKQGRQDKAIEKFMEAAKLSPDNPTPRFNLAMAAAAAGQKELAIEQFRIYLRLTPEDANAHYNLGVLLAERGLKEEASHHFKEVLRINPGDAETRQQLSRLQR